jgi:serine/threonine protein kinase
MIATDDHLGLADFGLAWRLEEGGSSLAPCVGTPEYCAPGVLLGQPYGSEVDLCPLESYYYETLSYRVSMSLRSEFYACPKNMFLVSGR